jgi:gluconolactonase
MPGCSPQPKESAQPAEKQSAPAPKVEVATSVAFTEGPTVDADGNVYFSEMTSNRIMKLATDGTLSTFRSPSNRTNGLLFDEQFRLIACESGDGTTGLPRVTRTDMKTGKIEVLADRYEGKELNESNDVTIDGQGRLYLSDRPRANPTPAQTGVHAIYRIDPDGKITRILTEPDIIKPNGLTISPDDKIFYFLETHAVEGGPRLIRAYDLQPDGSVTNMRVFHDFYPGRSGDGMTIDSAGNLYVAAGLNRLRGTTETLDTKCGVHVFSPDGALKQFIPIPEDTITNVAFGGPDLKTVYVTAGKTLFRFTAELAGTRR